MKHRMLRKAPLMVLAVGAIMALLAAGIAYAMWAEEIHIEGTVNTGEVYLEWTLCSCNDSGLDPIAPYPWPYPEGFEQKDVGSVTCTIDEEDPRILHFTVENGYPSYYLDCQVHYKNTGTVPVIVSGYAFEAYNFTIASDFGANDGEVWLKYTDGVGVQMDPWNDTAEQAGSLEFHVEQMAAENATYTFDFVLCAAQWNEEASLAECLAAAP